MGAPPHTVLVVGGHVGNFGRFPAMTIVDLAAPVLARVLSDADVDVDDVEAAFVGNAFGGMLQQQESVLGQILLKSVGIAGIPIHTVKNACSSGSDAAHLAWTAVAYGQIECALVLGAEKLTHEDRGATLAALATATDRSSTSSGRSVFMDVNAERAKRYMDAYDATPRHFAQVAAKNRRHAALNERAAMREPIGVDAVLADKIVVAPLTRAMCGGIADGAAAALLVSERFARKRGLAGPRIAASAVATGVPEGRVPNATARAAKLAYEAAGIGPKDIVVAEVHDPTAPQELFDIEDLQLADRGGAIALTEAGETALGGRIPVNTSGGLAGRGHPIGATGVAQIVEIAEQLTGRAGARQVDAASAGLAQMAGGLLGEDSAVATVHILIR